MIIKSFKTPLEVLINCQKHIENYKLLNPLEYQNLTVHKMDVWNELIKTKMYSVYLDKTYSAGFKFLPTDDEKSIILSLRRHYNGVEMRPHQEYIWIENQFTRLNDVSSAVMIEYDDIIKKMVGLTHSLESDSFYWEVT